MRQVAPNGRSRQLREDAVAEALTHTLPGLGSATHVPRKISLITVHTTGPIARRGT
jgi:hypothetical protein